MRLPVLSISRTIAVAGSAYFAAILALVLSKTPLGSPLFFLTAAICTAAYALMLGRVWHEPRAPRRLFFTCLVLALAFRVPPAVAPVNNSSDMVRYLWDGRLQQLGFNPYASVPSDPSMAAFHTDETVRMPSRNDRTPYPPAAQLFFRLVVSLGNSTLAMKLALVLCDLVTILVVWQWLLATGRSEWLTLAYAWHPLVVFEVAHSGHIDALGALWIAAAAFWLARRRTGLASVAFVLAIASKLVPIVLAPLFIGRVRWRDAVLGGVLLVALYLPFTSADVLPVGAVPNVVDRIRFNGPAFAAVANVFSPRAAAAVAVALGLVVAGWARFRLAETDPAAWAWPMAVAVLFAPVIYPWYLLYLTPFLFTVPTLPLTAWTVSGLSAYHVWERSRHGGRWIVPSWTMAVEFGILAAAVVIWLAMRRRTTVASGSRTPQMLS